MLVFSLQVRCRDFKPMLRPAVGRLVKARALQGLAERISKYPQMWEGREFKASQSRHVEVFCLPRSCACIGADVGASQLQCVPPQALLNLVVHLLVQAAACFI
jgi:hypothetical protein